MKLGESTVKTSDKAVNYFADNNGKIEIVAGKTSTATTGQSSLLFYTEGNGKILVNGTMNATIKGGTTPALRGTAFYYKSPGASYGVFDKDTVKNYFDTSFGNGAGTSTLNNLTLNMEQGSRLLWLQM